MTRQENLRTASTRFGQSTEAFCRWVTNVETQVEDANSREAASALQDALDVRWEKIQEKWEELVETYPEEEVVRDDQGDEVVDPDQAELERGKYRIRMEYLNTAEAAQNRLETAIRAKITAFNIAARARTRDADQERENAHALGNNAAYKTALEVLDRRAEQDSPPNHQIEGRGGHGSRYTELGRGQEVQEVGRGHRKAADIHGYHDSGHD